ncbi:hypothetical protein [Nocardia sp. BMG51109]|uniref:hypothetical protein n=1 Tax=Nocardia sp. BMG51109 TaxID=1056816 RepID=UPI000466DB8F|nr:hypothetical protein [Nocardia sp. BMG51109]
MTMPEPLPCRHFVYAEGKLAEFMCQASLMELTLPRARELRYLHREHRPDECLVHLETASFVLRHEEE